MAFLWFGSVSFISKSHLELKHLFNFPLPQKLTCGILPQNETGVGKWEREEERILVPHHLLSPLANSRT